MDLQSDLPLTTEQEVAARRYRRLLISRQDLSEALACIDLIDRSGLKRAGSGSHPLELIILTTALVVSYARPFVGTRGSGELADRVLPGSILRPLTRTQRELHDLMIHLRQKEIAHSDVEVLELSFRLFPGGESSIFRTTRDPLYRRELDSLRPIIGKIEKQIELQCDELRQLLPHFRSL